MAIKLEEEPKSWEFWKWNLWSPKKETFRQSSTKKQKDAISRRSFLAGIGALGLTSAVVHQKWIAPDHLDFLHIGRKEIISIGGKPVHLSEGNFRDLNRIAEIQTIFDNEDIFKSLILYLHNEEILEGRMRAHAEFLVGKYFTKISSTGVFELNINEYANNTGLSGPNAYNQAYNDLQDFLKSLRAIVTKMEENLNYLQRLGYNPQGLTDKEKVFYLATSHNGGFTINFGLKLQILTNKALKEFGNTTDLVDYDGSIGPQTRDAMSKIVDLALSNSIINAAGASQFRADIPTITNPNFHRIDNTPFCLFILEMDNPHKKFYIHEEDIPYLRESPASMSVNYGLRAVKLIFS